jgi:RHS repeat-associated protein
MRLVSASAGSDYYSTAGGELKMNFLSKPSLALLVFFGAGVSTAWGVPPSVNYEYDDYGNCKAITSKDAGGNVLERTTYTYDDYGRCTSMIEAEHISQSRKWNWHYDRYFDGVGTISASAHTSKKWRVQVEPAFNEAGDRRLSAQKFDYNDQIVEVATGLFETASGAWNTGPDTELHYFSYDKNGNKETFTDPRGRLTTYEYDLRDRLKKTIEPLNRITETLYDTTGNKTDVTFPDTRSQHWRDYDVFGQAWTFIDERNNTTNLTYQWGPMKKLQTATTHRDKDGGGTEDQRTTFYYTGLGLPQWTVFPDGSSELTTYKYGQVDAFKTRKNQAKRINYDARGREISHTWDGEAAPGISRSWDDANRVLTLCNIYSTIDYAYDGSGLVIAEGNTIAGSGTVPGSAERRQTTLHRYADGSVSAIQYPDGIWIYRDYTARGQLKTVEDNVSGPVIDYTYFQDGKVNEAVYGNGTTTAFGYDGRGMISSVQHKKNNGQNLSDRTYYRDTRDRIYAFKKSTSNSLNPMEDGKGDRFRYDEEGQLVEAWYNATDPANSGAGNSRYDGFNYDALGNRRGANFIANRGPMDFTRKDNGLNQYRAWWPFSFTNYDDDLAGWGAPAEANGVLMQDGNITAGYNALNQPMMINAPAYNGNWMFFGFDPLGRCVKRWVGALYNGGVPPPDSNPATYFYYEGWNLIQEGPGASNASRNYVHGARVDEIVKQITPNNWWARFFHYDARGHATLQTDGWGNIVEQYEYDAFGQPYFYDGAGNNIGHSPWGNRFLFTGREYLSDLKLYDYRHRLYQPELGRFMQPDPIQFKAGDYNLYRYCHNDPVNKLDPMGLGEFDLREWLTGALDAAAFGMGSANREAQGDIVDKSGESYFSGMVIGTVVGMGTGSTETKAVQKAVTSAPARSITARLIQHTGIKDLIAAAKEAVSGNPFKGQHLKEVSEAASGLAARIKAINNGLSSPTLSPLERAALTQELATASKNYDAAKEAMAGKFKLHDKK